MYSRLYMKKNVDTVIDWDSAHHDFYKSPR